MPINSFNDYVLTWKPDRRRLKRPIYQSLSQQLEQDIADGSLPPGTKLPPQRELADFLDVNFTTITRVYKISEHKGLTYGIVGKGTFVASNATLPITIASQPSSKEMIELGFNSSFESCNDLVAKVVEQTVKTTDISQLLNYYEQTGSLKQKLAGLSFLKRMKMTGSVENLAIASGGQNALAVAVLAMFEPGDRIAVDEFTYANFIELAILHHLRLVPIAGDEQGMSDQALLAACKLQGIKGIYLMPNGANPTTTYMTAARRQKIAQLINRYELILIEDDYLGFTYLGSDQQDAPLSALTPAHSIYVCSLSKSISSGLRVAYMLFAPAYKKQILRALFNITVKTSSLDVEVITNSILSGVAYRLIEMKKQLALQANLVFDQVFDQQPVPHNPYTFFRWLPLRQRVNGQQFEAEMLANHIRVFHSDRFIVGDATSQPNYLRISLASGSSLVTLKHDLLALKQQAGPLIN